MKKSIIALGIILLWYFYTGEEGKRMIEYAIWIILPLAVLLTILGAYICLTDNSLLAWSTLLSLLVCIWGLLNIVEMFNLMPKPLSFLTIGVIPFVGGGLTAQFLTLRRLKRAKKS